MELKEVKTALRISGDDFDSEIIDLMNARSIDLSIAGVEVPEEVDAIVDLAVKTFVKMHFGNPENFDKLKKSYEEQKAQLATATGYTKWTEAQ